MIRDIEAEHGVIGSLLIDPHCLHVIRKHVSKMDFVSPTNQHIFDAAISISDAGNVPDVISIGETLKKDGAFSGEVARYIYDLSQVTVTSSSAEEYAKITAEHSARRKMIEILDAARERLVSYDASFEVAAEAIAGLRHSIEKEQGNAVITMPDAAVEFYDNRNEIDSGRVKVVPVGYQRFDETMGGGLMCGGFYILAARPGIGKTTFSNNIAIRAAKKGKKILYVPLEMSTVDMFSKILSNQIGVSSTKLAIGKFEEHEVEKLYDKISDGVSKLQGLPLYFYNIKKGIPSVSDIVAHARIEKFDMVIIDYIGLMKKEPGKDNYERMTNTSIALKQAAMCLEVPLLCLAQLNRESEQRGGRPRISDLRDSGGLEQDADAIFLLELPREDRNTRPLQDHEPEELLVHIGKNRRGRTGTLDYDFYMAQGIIHERRR